MSPELLATVWVISLGIMYAVGRYDRNQDRKRER